MAYAMAPPSVGNMAVGFDILGHALAAQGDQVRARQVEPVGVRMGQVSGVVDNLPDDPLRNTAGAAVHALLHAHPVDFGIELDLYKGIALGSGMGGSAASAVAAVVAANQLLPQPLMIEELLPYALAGEQVASGALHGDNVAPCLFGGIVLIPPSRPNQYEHIPVPDELHAVLVRPEIRLDTEAGRSLLSSDCALSDVVRQSANLGSFLCACYTNNLARLADVLQDVLVEPQRSHQVEGFNDIRQQALAGGALGFALSGSGPSMVAWGRSDQAEHLAQVLATVTTKYYKDYQLVSSPVAAPGAQLIDETQWRGK